MSDDVTDARAELEALRAQMRDQEAELQRLRTERAPAGPTRRDMLKGAGLVAGGLAALTVGVGAARSTPAAAIEGHNVRLRGPGNIFLTLSGTKTGAIQGDSVRSGRENTIEVEYLQQKVKTPIDPSTGASTGRRQYEPFVIRKRVERSTPLLLNALITNETLTGSFKFYKVDQKTGTEVNFYTIELKNARVISHNEYSPQANDSGAGSSAVPSMEEVAFVFQTITWTIEDGGITATDTISSTA